MRSDRPPPARRGCRGTCFAVMACLTLCAVSSVPMAQDGDGPAPTPVIESDHRFTLPLNNPQYVAGKTATFMRDGDYVVGVVNRNVARAYPWAVLANHHIVNDTIAGDHVLVSHCEVCSSASAFRVSGAGVNARLDGTAFVIDKLALGTWIGRDTRTGSLWHPFMGEAIEGPLEGTTLPRVPTFTSSWSAWLSAHPDTQVVVLTPEMRKRPHGLGHFPGDRSVYPGKTQEEFAALLAANEKLRWRNPAETVVGVFDRSGPTRAARAWPLSDLVAQAPAALDVVVGAEAVVIVIAADDPARPAVAVYSTRRGNRRLALSVHTTRPLVLADRDGGLWSAWGECISGPEAGARLDVADSYTTKWYEWVESFPDTTLAGKRLSLSVSDALDLARAKPMAESQAPWEN